MRCKIIPYFHFLDHLNRKYHGHTAKLGDDYSAELIWNDLGRSLSEEEMDRAFKEWMQNES